MVDSIATATATVTVIVIVVIFVRIVVIRTLQTLLFFLLLQIIVVSRSVREIERQALVLYFYRTLRLLLLLLKKYSLLVISLNSIKETWKDLSFIQFR